MASINNEPILITFEELKHLEIEDIALCIDKYNALNICGKSSALATDIYNVWVNKLFKAYDISEFNDEDWQQILGYLENVLNKFIQNCPALNDDLTSKQLNQWWMDTMELLQWLQTVIDKLDKHILGLILAFGLEIIIKTCKITHKRNIQHILKIQKQLLHMVTNHMLKMDLQNAEDFKGLNKVLTSLCDVGSLISSSDIKLSIETWRIVAKLSGKCNESFNDIDDESKETIKELRRNWTEKPISGIMMELHKLFKYFLEDDDALNNDNILKVAQFYLKLVKILIKNTSTFSVVKEYFEVYTIFMHQLRRRTAKNQLVDYIQQDLNEILALVHHETSVQKHLCQHLLDDNKELVSCNLILEYMRICFDKDRKHIPDVQFVNRIFGVLFDGPLIFIDVEKYPKVVIYYAALTARDVTSQLHMFWCNNVMDLSWTKAYVSCEILRIYYGYIFKSSNEKAKECLEFWIKCWQKYNISSCTTVAAFNHQKFLIQMIIKTIVSHLPEYIIEQCFNISTHSEIILLKCGKENAQLLCHLNTNLMNNLRKIHGMKLMTNEYTELVNLMDIWCCHSKFVNVCAIKDDLIKSFLTVFSLSLVDMRKFKDFLDKSFCVFKILNDIQVDRIILKCLQENLNKTKALVGAFMLEYLLKQTPRSELLLQSLQTPEVIKLQRYLESATGKLIPNTPNDLRNVHDLYIKSLSNSKHAILYDVHISKRPRVGDTSDSTDYKFILNEMLERSHQILNFSTTVYDTTDYELLNCIKHNIEKCLIK